MEEDDVKGFKIVITAVLVALQWARGDDKSKDKADMARHAREQADAILREVGVQ